MNAIVKAAAAATKSKLNSHYQSLVAERKAGSKWGKSPGEEIFDLEWNEFTPEVGGMPGCKYFEADISSFAPQATVGAVALESLTTEQIANVRVVQGAHGLELQLSGPQVPTNTATLIIGEEPGVGEVVFTVHPGKPLAPLHKQTAVKA